MSPTLTRAEFLKLMAGATAWLASPASAFAAAGPLAAAPLPLTAVRLTGGPLKHAQELDARYLLSLDPDRMLAFYRVRAGLEPKAPGLTGWDADGRQLTGHIAGHHLSAVSLMWAATGDARFKERADYLVSELAVVQAKNGDGFAGALDGVKAAFADVSKGRIRAANFDLNGLWSPWYTLHKTFAGLRDAYRHTGNRAALDVETKFAAWAAKYLDPMDDAEVQRMLACEFGGMNEVLADLYADTGDTRWLDLSYKFEHQAVFGPLRRGVDPLDGLHGNTQVPKAIGLAARYVHAGRDEDLAAASFFWDTVVDHHTFATGGHGKDEYFRDPDHLGNITGGRTSETCNVYNMLKLTRMLFAIRPEVRYAEFQERALFNHILGSMDPEDGATCYMVPVGEGVRREYANMQRSFTCCVGTGQESHALHGLGLYYESLAPAAPRLWVNVYAPSTAAWTRMGATLEMATGFPLGDDVSMAIALREPKSFTVSLRRPSWAREGFSVMVNGRAVSATAAPGAYVDIAREWRNGDRVSIVLPKTLSLVRLPDMPTRAVAAWGPLVLAGDLGPQPVSREDDGEQRAAADPPKLVTTDPIEQWLKPVAGQPGRFRAAGIARRLSTGERMDVEFEPFHSIHRRTYTAYWDVLDEAAFEARRAEAAKARADDQALAGATVAALVNIDSATERRFNLQSEESTIFRQEGVSGRRASKWFEYTLDAGGATTLVVDYNRDNRRERRFRVLVDGVVVAREVVPKSSVSAFFHVRYALPAAFDAGDRAVVVRFEADEGSETAPVFAVRTIRG